MAHLGQTIADLRQERNLSQAELAADILSPAQLSKAEHGLTDLSGTKLVMLLGRLHITPREFFSLAEIQTASETIEEQLISDTYTSLVKNDQQLGRQVIRQAEIFDQQA
ncbi:helix-turn-helix domain-containing protein [Lapidilactobacillus gannanensis]|uniref:Helix-turn-helix domain-containing protein n=1 Tax=Lapidilactobacillus gannanensis TaxID=2486002 RepID=A0ABW4BIH0_9LACO|nr:helix-turn-helix transcriptional regulator [Lapidilactobacillus gannanensis]